MPLERTFIPYGAYWSTPFCRWQGGLGGFHALELAARAGRAFFAAQKLGVEAFDGVALGTTVPQRHAFYGAPWVAAMLGMPGVTGPTIAQACATSAAVLAHAALEVEAGVRECVLAVTADRTSNGPHLYYPNPRGPGGRGDAEDWVWDNFNRDPWGEVAMVQTAENVGKQAGIGRKEQEEMCLLRHAQYADALANERAFQRRYLVPVALDAKRSGSAAVELDDGVRTLTAADLAAQKPVLRDGTVTSGTQTFPGDGNAGIVVTTAERARSLARDPAVTVALRAFADARVDKAHMPAATVPAARRVLERAGLGLAELRAIKTHNPFALNDVYFCKQLGLAPERVNRFGSSLVYGHPQAPTGARAVMELIEELVLAGGGHGLFAGCAAGDTAMALVLTVR
ncbi:MAG: thiolase family protein [Polyangiaceae bacterium]|nr:thiolase family protein [Polyangiaceae bacterium]